MAAVTQASSGFASRRAIRSGKHATRPTARASPYGWRRACAAAGGAPLDYEAAYAQRCTD